MVTKAVCDVSARLTYGHAFSSVVEIKWSYDGGRYVTYRPFFDLLRTRIVSIRVQNSGRWESNPRKQLGRLAHCHCATPARRLIRVPLTNAGLAPAEPAHRRGRDRHGCASRRLLPVASGSTSSRGRERSARHVQRVSARACRTLPATVARGQSPPRLRRTGVEAAFGDPPPAG